MQDQQFVLKEGEWSGWVPVEFQLMPVIGNVKGICRFYLKQAHPRFQLYVSPINIDPGKSGFADFHSTSYSRDLAKQIGEFHTQGIAEDTKALTAGVLDDKEFLEQSHTVLAEHRRAFEVEFPKFQQGLFFFYFSSLDLNAHMLWRLTDPLSPAYDAALAAQYGSSLEEFYEQIDQVLGEVMPKVDDNTTLLVLSDHGFAPYRRSFNLNTWLLNNGYITRKEGAGGDSSEPFADVDWSRTRAYGLGMNGLYLNLRGREREGIVDPAQADRVAAGDPRETLGVSRSEGWFAGDYANRPGQRSLSGAVCAHGAGCASSATIAGIAPDGRRFWGRFRRTCLEDNTNAWSGDHCMDFTKVPGVLLSNRKIDAQTPALTDIAPTILSEFGIAKTKDMMGQSVFQRR